MCCSSIVQLYWGANEGAAKKWVLTTLDDILDGVVDDIPDDTLDDEFNWEMWAVFSTGSEQTASLSVPWMSFGWSFVVIGTMVTETIALVEYTKTNATNDMTENNKRTLQYDLDDLMMDFLAGSILGC